MKHTECKDCKLSNGDCGHHFKMDGATNYDIASLSACDKYGNCEFFKSKVKPQGDLISREALKKAIKNLYNETLDGIVKFGIEKAYKEIDNAPAIEPEVKEVPKGEWIDVPCERDLLFNTGIKYTCSVCEKFNSNGHSSFCPNCGADMRGGAE